MPQLQTVESPWNFWQHVPNQAELRLVWDKGASNCLYQSLHFVKQKQTVKLHSFWTFDATTDPGLFMQLN